MEQDVLLYRIILKLINKKQKQKNVEFWLYVVIMVLFMLRKICPPLVESNVSMEIKRRTEMAYWSYYELAADICLYKSSLAF